MQTFLEYLHANLVHLDIEPTRAADGTWIHPCLPWEAFAEGADMAPIFEEMGYDAIFALMSDEVDEDAYVAYESSETCLLWEPLSPGAGWFLVAIYFTEDGPCATWLKRKED